MCCKFCHFIWGIWFVTFLSLPNLKAALEETMQLRRLIKSSNEGFDEFHEASFDVYYVYVSLKLTILVFSRRKYIFSFWPWSLPKPSNPSSVERFSENVDLKALTYLIFFVWTHWFQKCNFWKNSLGPFWGRRGRRGQTTSKLKTTKILNENL